MRSDKSSKSRRIRRKKSLSMLKPTIDLKRHPHRSRKRRLESLRTHRERLAQIAQDTLHTILSTQHYAEGSSAADRTGEVHDLSGQITRSRQDASFYPHHSALLADWERGPALMPRSAPDPSSDADPPTTHFDFTSASPLAAAHRLWLAHPWLHVRGSGLGVLSAAAPRPPGAAARAGGDDPECGLVRQTTLYDALQNSSAGTQFYAAHRAESDGSGLADHAMLYVPHVTAFKDDKGRCLAPYTLGIVASVPVNAATVRAKFSIDEDEVRAGVCSVMRERMARALRLFEERGDRILVLGAFGVGQCRNPPDMIAEIWADLLHARGAKFKGLYDQVTFAVPGKHLSSFKEAFQSRCLEAELDE